MTIATRTLGLRSRGFTIVITSGPGEESVAGQLAQELEGTVVLLGLTIPELAELIRCIDRDILRPIAELNFGRAAQYQIQPRSLVETYSAMFGTREQVRTPRQQQDPVTAGEAKFQ